MLKNKFCWKWELICDGSNMKVTKYTLSVKKSVKYLLKIADHILYTCLSSEQCNGNLNESAKQVEGSE